MRFGGIVLATALALGACSSSDPAPIEPKRSATTPTPTATAPPMPDQARQDSPEGAAAFVKHYVDVFNYAAATGDVEELTRLSAPTCEACTKYAEEFRKIYGRGDRIAEVLWTMRPGELELVGDESVDADMDVNEGQTKRYRFRFALSEGPSRAVQDITILEAG